ncbi:MAG: homoserine dehydrogenase [Vicinamibacterales bacterium]
MPTLDSPAASNTWPLRVRAPKPVAGGAIRTIRIGILGLGQVGQAVARLAADRAATAHAGLRFQVEQALVRDVDKARRCPKPGRITSDASAFLRGNYDVVIEALGAVEPARTLVSRLLQRGTAVVTANKALVAAHLEHLESIAAAGGAAFRYEATALSAVPFLGTLAARPLVASVDRLLAIVNGTSNYVLTSLADPMTSVEQALSRAQALGYAEPDASRDLDGLDAADKLLLLTSLFGWGRLSREALEIDGIRHVTADDLAAARSIGGTIKAVVSGQRDHTGVRAFVGPAFLRWTAPLASLGGALNGIQLDGRYVSNLFFSGPGAGPDVTAATLLDDAIQAASSERRVHEPRHAPARPVFPSSPATSWFMRATFPGVLPPASAVAALVSTAGLPVEQVADHTSTNSRWLCIGPQSRRGINAAAEKLSSTHRIDVAAFRKL